MHSISRPTLVSRRRGLRAVLSAIAIRIAAWNALRHQRRTLCQMDDHMLRDIGLTRSDALREARRPAWDVPSHWLR